VSESGDLAYSFGNYEFRSIGKDGKPTIEHGKYTSIWKKQKDGRRKVVKRQRLAVACLRYHPSFRIR
jgi:ketosteroid isomerase-like protein